VKVTTTKDLDDTKTAEATKFCKTYTATSGDNTEKTTNGVVDIVVAGSKLALTFTNDSLSKIVCKYGDKEITKGTKIQITETDVRIVCGSGCMENSLMLMMVLIAANIIFN